MFLAPAAGCKTKELIAPAVAVSSGEELEPGAGCLGDDEPVERVVPEQLGKVADRLGVLGANTDD